jgi:hypothetical protein
MLIVLVHGMSYKYATSDLDKFPTSYFILDSTHVVFQSSNVSIIAVPAPGNVATPTATATAATAATAAAAATTTTTSYDSSISKGIGCKLDSWDMISDKSRDFSLCHHSQISYGSTQPPIQYIWEGGSFPGG